MSQVNVRVAGIEAHFEAQRLTLLQHTDKLVMGDDLMDSPTGYVVYDLFAKHG